MPRQPRLDAPGTLHHVMGRGIERTKVFQDDTDREDFVGRLAELCRRRSLVVYAWALMPNHFHLLVRTGQAPLPDSMRKLLTGYVVNFNRRHRRYGHLFQNRYKSIVVEDDPYLLEVTRYIHLNPVRGGLVPGVRALRRYPWTGHAAILGTLARDWQDTATILADFGQPRRRAVARYEAFVQEGLAQGRRPDLVGGGLIRSLGGWAQVLSLRRKGVTVPADARILGSGEFTEQMLADAARRELETLRLSRKMVDLATVAQRITAGQEVTDGELRSGSRRKAVVRARRVFCQVAVRGLGYSGATVARFLGVTTSSVNRLAVSEELPESKKFLNVR
ncbi:MAG TPA: transposase [Candidatus Methylomirabilis sp.]|nr:transposase [Candidatus Methylomirabilis sp.]HSB80090.1 transposase [Candidatus Methylomirabilis sp.]